MHKRQLGKNGPHVSGLGLGCERESTAADFPPFGRAEPARYPASLVTFTYESIVNVTSPWLTDRLDS
jgi:hypothetical protein